MAGGGESPDHIESHIKIKGVDGNGNYRKLEGHPSKIKAEEALEQVAGLKCPRCHSTNTKFCYFNNYNKMQPRHFCKNCRRYWTHGGSLRMVPIGGGCRTNNKRTGDTSYTGAAKNKRLCSITSPNGTITGIPDTQLAALNTVNNTNTTITTTNNNLGSIGCHLSAVPCFPAASILTCTPNSPSPVQSSFMAFPEPSFDASVFFNADSETLPLFHSSMSEDPVSALSSSGNIPMHSYLQDQVGLTGDGSYVWPHLQHYNVHDHESLDSLLSKGMPFPSLNTAEGQDFFDVHQHHPAYCYSNFWTLPTEFHTQSISPSTLI